MSKILEYLKLVPAGIKNIDKVVEGIINDIALNKLPENEREEIIKRRVICAGCPFMSKNAKTSEEFKELMGHNYVTSRTDDHCTFCGCPIATRTASLDMNCGVEAYNKNTNKPIPLKWEALKK